jgi:uncharacterized protein YbjQ (UPF0145 family)
LKEKLMAECIECGAKIGFLNGGKDGKCSRCAYAEHMQRMELASVEIGSRQSDEDGKREAERLAIEAIILTTEATSDLKIIRRVEVITAECAFGMNIFKDLFAGIRDIVGGRSEAIQKTMRDARRTTLYELKKEAFAVGANAVVGVDLDYVELSSAGNMVMLVASGTAVIIGD